ncbi:phage baseplate assembly protein V [Yinghuangia seranimata]|uniref:phage baseplate assembly protein V n=1 Tax=Yinghuangia seranimata TaxID=408067 RepID=UPI00248ABF9C|nr:phage baseplate assembly protein V [Yinghuangia seranimata]MDI2131687.1 phage baseplate assembly protein V [Yinghuangia seranimata]
MERFHGRYPAVVVDNEDPKKLCRLRVKVPEVLGEQTTGWCLASSPYAGPGVGLAVVPPKDALVFVEWPAGDVGRVPVWSGAAWAQGDGVPGAGPKAVVLVTPAGNRVELLDESGGEAVKVTAASGASVTLDASGAVIAFGSQKIAMTGSGISFNDGALEVR